jgi:hypothetical protein
MKKPLDVRNLLAILFVIAGVLPIAWWLGVWAYHSLRQEHVIQVGLVLVVLYAAWWIRRRLDRK